MTPRLAQPADQVDNLMRLLRHHARGWLVEDQQTGLERERAGDLDTALVAVGQLARHAEAVCPDADPVEERLGMLDRGLALSALGRACRRARRRRRRACAPSGRS